MSTQFVILPRAVFEQALRELQFECSPTAKAMEDEAVRLRLPVTSIGLSAEDVAAKRADINAVVHAHEVLGE